ncbi:MAG: hypothetical protein IPO23_02920 [Flavobacterium sp.]|nr:hypothetical protein [Flavobacterium sp.]
MDANNEIRLRLRFYKDVDDNIENVQQKFENYSKNDLTDFAINVHENHIWFYVIGPKKRFWSPHLHLQLEPKTEKETHIRGLFGPDQTLWTFFMFLHFIVAGIFTIFAMFAYSNYTLKQPVTLDVLIMLLMVIVWFLLYFIARQVRKKGNEQMNEMERLFLKIIE